MMCDWVVLLIVRAEGKICFTTQMSFPWEIKQVVVSRNVGCFVRLYLRWTLLYKIFVELVLACEQALLFGRVKRVSRERARERRSREGQNKRPLAREARFANPNRRACSQAKWFLFTTAKIFPFAFHSFLFYSLLRADA